MGHERQGVVECFGDAFRHCCFDLARRDAHAFIQISIWIVLECLADVVAVADLALAGMGRDERLALCVDQSPGQKTACP